MRKELLSGELISLKEASEISGYHPDYLGYLIRKGKIEGKRAGRDWFTTEKAVKNYLSTKKFLPIKDILFSKVSPRMLFISFGAAILIGVGAFLFFSSQNYFQKVPGDFSQQELQTKNIGPLKVTTYSSDSAGGIEISIKPEGTFQVSKKKPSFPQKIRDFFQGIVK
ncbi:hypothetical protein J7K42_01195 [bacterium]|nr:hypothetical protein [bacterium]